VAIDWLNENSRRAYPFVDAAPVGGYREAIVDAVFTLGSDYDFDFSEETSEFRLVTVANVSGVWQLTFQYFQHGVQVPATPSMVFTLGAGGPKDVVIRAVTAGSHGFLTIGDSDKFAVESPGAAVEARTILAPSGGTGQTVKVYNSDRRKSYRPYFIANPGKTPGQNYRDAKAAAPAWNPNICLQPPVGALTGTVYWLAGFNTTILPSLSTQSIFFGLSVGAGGCNLCGIYDYVQSKMGTSDVCADLNKDGIVDAADLALAQTLTVTPKEITFQGSLRSFNGALPSGGDLVFTVGPRVTIVAIPDTNTLELKVLQPNPPQNCLRPV
jgi:hypothetical protein